ncbi:MAG: hypothetical protein IT379_41640, partial [Deltaproteobacteria bacterium]|nr:hypothetical protein [Deltaproteobacteria bacterium]
MWHLGCDGTRSMMTESPSYPSSYGTMPPRADAHVLAATLFLENPVLWARGGVVAALTDFLRVAGVASVEWWRTSIIGGWQGVSASGLPSLVEALGAWSFPHPSRPLFGFALVDDPEDPATVFLYREIDVEGGARRAVLEVTLPVATDPERFHALVREMASRGPWTNVEVARRRAS